MIYIGLDYEILLFSAKSNASSLIISFGLLALAATYFYPYKPRPGPRPLQGQCEHPWLAKIGLVELSSGEFTEREEDEEEEKKVVSNGSEHNRGYQVS